MITKTLKVHIIKTGDIVEVQYTGNDFIRFLLDMWEEQGRDSWYRIEL